MVAEILHTQSGDCAMASHLRRCWISRGQRLARSDRFEFRVQAMEAHGQMLRSSLSSGASDSRKSLFKCETLRRRNDVPGHVAESCGGDTLSHVKSVKENTECCGDRVLCGVSLKGSSVCLASGLKDRRERARNRDRVSKVQEVVLHGRWS